MIPLAAAKLMRSCPPGTHLYRLNLCCSYFGLIWTHVYFVGKIFVQLKVSAHHVLFTVVTLNMKWRQEWFFFQNQDADVNVAYVRFMLHKGASLVVLMWCYYSGGSRIFYEGDEWSLNDLSSTNPLDILMQFFYFYLFNIKKFNSLDRWNRKIAS